MYISKLECIINPKITGIYTIQPKDLEITKKITKEILYANNSSIDIKKILFHLSCNVKNTKVNNKVKQNDIRKSNVLIYQN